MKSRYRYYTSSYPCFFLLRPYFWEQQRGANLISFSTVHFYIALFTNIMLKNIGFRVFTLLHFKFTFLYFMILHGGL